MSKRLLVVGDESIQDLTCFLTDAGFEMVGIANDGERAIELAYEHLFRCKTKNYMKKK